VSDRNAIEHVEIADRKSSRDWTMLFDRWHVVEDDN
jgi:hypothetical protein